MSRKSDRLTHQVVRLAAVAGAYVVAAKFGINLSVAHGVITPVWVPSGLSIAALLIFGRGLWPAVALGAFISNATSGADPLVAAGLAIGNTLEATAGAFLLEKVGFRRNLERVRDVFALVVLGAGASTLIAATNGVSVLKLAGATHGSYGSEWLLWWFGDAVGVLLVAPLLLLVWTHRRTRPGKAQLLEGLILFCSLGALSAIVFLGGGWRYPYLIFPLLLWAALRFRQIGCATSSFLVGAMATWGTMSGTVPIAHANTTERVQIIQALVGLVSISLLVVGATLAERETANVALRQTALMLAEAQSLTHIGSWEWNAATNTISSSDELYRIFGLAPQSIEISYERFLERVHPDDRAFVDEAARCSFSERQSFSFEHRIVRSDGVSRLPPQPRACDGRYILEHPACGRDKPGRHRAAAGEEPPRRHPLDRLARAARTAGIGPRLLADAAEERGQDRRPGARAGIVDKIVGRGPTARAAAERSPRQRKAPPRARASRASARRCRRPDTRHRRRARCRGSGHRRQCRTDICERRPGEGGTHRRQPLAERRSSTRHVGTPIELRLDHRADDLLTPSTTAGPASRTSQEDDLRDLRRGVQIEPGARRQASDSRSSAAWPTIHGGRAWVEDNACGGASFRILLPDCLLPQPRGGNVQEQTARMLGE